MDQDTVSTIYMGMVKLVSQELRTNKIVRLPHLGDFALVEQKSRPAWTGRAHVQLGAKDILKFYPKEALRRYFSKWQESG